MNALGQFYTERHISHLLVSKIQQDMPNNVLDLGVGQGSLLKAAWERWLNANFYCTDIDTSGIKKIRKEIPSAVIKRINGLSGSLQKELKLQVGSIDVAVCNPPYLKISATQEMLNILEYGGLLKCTKLPRVTSDIVFLAQNLKMLRKGGELGIILPDSLLTGQEFKLLREEILVNHRVTGIIQLPDKVFRKTEARTHILLLEKGGNIEKYVPLYKSDIYGTCNDMIQISINDLIQRMDHSYYFWRENRRSLDKSISLSEVDCELKRGSFSHKELKEKNLPFFHTSDFPKQMAMGVRFLTTVEGRGVIAQPGDILLARVGRGCIGRVAIVLSGSAWITDCVYRLRVPNAYTQRVLSALLSSEGQQALKALSHGVCAKIISKADLMKFPINLKSKK